MRRYLIERDIPGVGGMSIVELCGAARASNRAIEQIGDGIQWQHSYVAGDKTFCIYLAASEELIRKHAELSGIPITRIVESSSSHRPADRKQLSCAHTRRPR
jgi:hypothetical protein